MCLCICILSQLLKSDYFNDVSVKQNQKEKKNYIEQLRVKNKDMWKNNSGKQTTCIKTLM